MIDLSFTMIMQWINFIVLLLILYRVLFKPVTRFLDERQNKISESLQEATEKRETADKVLKDYEGKLSGVRDEALQILERAKKEGHDEHMKIVKDAHMEAHGVIERARQDAGLQAEKASLELRRQLAGLIVAGASRLLEREVREQDHRRLIDDFIKELSEKEDKNKKKPK